MSILDMAGALDMFITYLAKKVAFHIVEEEEKRKRNRGEK